MIPDAWWNNYHFTETPRCQGKGSTCTRPALRTIRMNDYLTLNFCGHCLGEIAVYAVLLDEQVQQWQREQREEWG
jgi:hypothetical protein